MDKRNRAIIILSILTVIFTIMGGTLAYFQWSSNAAQNTAVTFTVQSGFSCSADGGGSITSNDKVLAPAACTNTTYAIKRTITVRPTITQPNKDIYLDLWLKVNSLGTGLSNSGSMYYSLTTSPSSCTAGVVAYGLFSETDTQIELLHLKKYSSTTTETYYLWIWLDARETSSNTQNQPFDIELGGTCTDEVPITFSGTIYSYDNNNIKIGNRIDLQKFQKWCAIHPEYGNSCDYDYSWETESDCKRYLYNQNMEDAVCELMNIYKTDPANLINKPIYLKRVIVDDILTEAYVGLAVTEEMKQEIPELTVGTYYLRGVHSYDEYANECIDQYYDSNTGNCVSPYYNANRTELQSIFGSTYCTDYSSYISCSVSGLFAFADRDGYVSFGFGTSGCSIDKRGEGYCSG